MNKYQWKMKGLAKGIDPDIAMKELERIEKKYGSITPEIVLEASEPEDAVLHALFEWDDSIAARKYRLHQARTIINNIEVSIVSNEEVKYVPVFEFLKPDDRNTKSYKSVESMSKNEVEIVALNTAKDLQRIKRKLDFYNSFKSASMHINAAIIELNKTNELPKPKSEPAKPLNGKRTFNGAEVPNWDAFMR